MPPKLCGGFYVVTENTNNLSYDYDVLLCHPKVRVTEKAQEVLADAGKLAVERGHAITAPGLIIIIIIIVIIIIISSSSIMFICIVCIIMLIIINLL